MSARCSRLRSIIGMALRALFKSDKSRNNNKSTFRTKGNKVFTQAGTKLNEECLSN